MQERYAMEIGAPCAWCCSMEHMWNMEVDEELYEEWDIESVHEVAAAC